MEKFLCQFLLFAELSFANDDAAPPLEHFADQRQSEEEEEEEREEEEKQEEDERREDGEEKRARSCRGTE